MNCAMSTRLLFGASGGAVSESDKNAAFAAGAQGYIAKPFDADVLSATLKAALKVV